MEKEGLSNAGVSCRGASGWGGIVGRCRRVGSGGRILTVGSEGPCSEKRARHPERGGGTEAPQAFRRGEHRGRVGSIPVVFPPGMAGHPCLILWDVPFPPRSTGEYRKGMISARPLYQGVRRSICDPETSKVRMGVR
jgi:hypothetical protein